jgi:hypothetical protein
MRSVRLKLTNPDGVPCNSDVHDADTGEKVANALSFRLVYRDGLLAAAVELDQPEVDVVATDQDGRRIRVVKKPRSNFVELFDVETGEPLWFDLLDLDVTREKIYLLTDRSR